MNATAGLLMFLFTPSYAAAAVTVNCPPTLEIEESAEPPNGWEANSRRDERELGWISVYSGHPRFNYRLKPIMLPTKDGFDVAEWGVYGELWLECTYRGTLITLVRPLPTDLKSCRAYYKHENGSIGRFERLVCE